MSLQILSLAPPERKEKMKKEKKKPTKQMPGSSKGLRERIPPISYVSSTLLLSSEVDICLNLQMRMFRLREYNNLESHSLKCAFIIRSGCLPASKEADLQLHSHTLLWLSLPKTTQNSSVLSSLLCPEYEAP